MGTPAVHRKAVPIGRNAGPKSTLTGVPDGRPSRKEPRPGKVKTVELLVLARPVNPGPEEFSAPEIYGNQKKIQTSGFEIEITGFEIETCGRETCEGRSPEARTGQGETCRGQTAR